MSSTSPTFLSRPSSPVLGWSSKFGLVGACLYITGFALPLQWDIIPLLVLALSCRGAGGSVLRSAGEGCLCLFLF
jgi:hypothetical protein